MSYTAKADATVQEMLVKHDVADTDDGGTYVDFVNGKLVLDGWFLPEEVERVLAAFREWEQMSEGTDTP